MKYFLIIIVLILGFCLPVNAEMLLTGEVDYTTEGARNELLQTQPLKPDENLILIHIEDENYNRNISALLNGSVELKDRTLALFSDNSYAVMYKADEFHVWYYSPQGKLTHCETKDGLVYPYKSYKYDMAGSLVNMGLRVSKAETFIFNKQGKLLAHWIKSNGYDENGNLVMRRKYLE